MSVGYRSGTAVDGGARTDDPSHLPAYEFFYDIANPSGLTVGDLMIYAGHWYQPVDGTWTFAGEGSGTSLWFFYKFVTAGDVAAGSVRVGIVNNPTHPDSRASRVVGVLAAWTGVQTVTVTPANVSEAVVGATSAFIVAPNATVRSNAVSARVARVFAVSGDAEYGTDPAGTTPRVSAFATLVSGSSLEGVNVVDASHGAGSVGTASAGFNGGTFGGVAYAQTFVLEGNHTPATPSITSPPNASTFATTANISFESSFSDIDPGDSESASDYQYSSDGGSTWTTVSGDSSGNLTITAGTLTAGSYQIQARSYDQSSVVSGWSPSLFFTVAPPPPAPVTTTPTSGSTVGIAAAETWTVTNQDGYETQVIGDISGTPDPTTLYYGSGLIMDPSARGVTLRFPVNSVAAHIRTRVIYGGVFSAWSTDVPVTVAWVLPEIPTLTITESPTSAGIRIDITTVLNSLPSDAVSVNLYASRDDGATVEWDDIGIDPNGFSVFYTPASDRDYSFQAIAYAADGTPATTAWVGSTSGSPADLRPVLIDAGRLGDLRTKIYEGGSL